MKKSPYYYCTETEVPCITAHIHTVKFFIVSFWKLCTSHIKNICFKFRKTENNKFISRYGFFQIPSVFQYNTFLLKCKHFLLHRNKKQFFPQKTAESFSLGGFCKILHYIYYVKSINKLRYTYSESSVIQLSRARTFPLSLIILFYL